MAGVMQLNEQYKIFCKMFPKMGINAKYWKEAHNGAGIQIHMKDGTDLLFSYKSPKIWWLRTV